LHELAELLNRRLIAPELSILACFHHGYVQRKNLMAQFYKRHSRKLTGGADSNEFIVGSETLIGCLGLRELGDRKLCIRVEPTSPYAASVIGHTLTRSLGWSQPNGEEMHFSKVMTVIPGAKSPALREAADALVGRGLPPQLCGIWMERCEEFAA
jgi:hypothetical protein